MPPPSRPTPARCRRIAIVAGLSPRKLGSMEQWLVGMAVEGRRRGHEVTVYSLPHIHPSIAAALAGAGVGWHPFRPGDGMWPLRRAWEGAYDLIHLDLFGLISRPAWASYLSRGCRVVFVDHFSGAPGRPRFERRRLLAPVLNRRIAAFVGVSGYVTRRATSEFGIDEARAFTIYNGVDVARYQPAPPRTASGPAQILAVANLIPEKGLHHLIDALALLGDHPVLLKVVGDGPERAALERRVNLLALRHHVEFLGLRDDVDRLMQESDLMVHPATWQEAFGLTIAEAMASGIPVVATRTGGIPELVEDGVTGLLVAPGSSHDLGGAIRHLLDDGELRSRMGAAGRKRVEESFSLDQCISRHWEICEAVLAETP